MKKLHNKQSKAQNKPLLFIISGLKAEDIPATNVLDSTKATARKNIENYVVNLIKIINSNNIQNQ